MSDTLERASALEERKEESYKFALLKSYPQMAGYLLTVLEPQTILEITGVKETRAIRDSAKGVRGVRSDAKRRQLRLTTYFARFLETPHNSEIVDAWMTQPNAMLEGDYWNKVPAAMLRDYTGDPADNEQSTQVQALFRSASRLIFIMDDIYPDLSYSQVTQPSETALT